MTAQLEGPSQPFQYLRGQLEVGGLDEYDAQLLQRLLPRVGLSVKDRESVKKELVKGHLRIEAEAVRAQILWGGSGAHSDEATTALEEWAEERGRKVEWLEPSELGP
jgi:hypothetical protein